MTRPKLPRVDRFHNHGVYIDYSIYGRSVSRMHVHTPKLVITAPSEAERIAPVGVHYTP